MAPTAALHLGAGLALKPQHFNEARDCRDSGLWFEVHPENYMVEGGPRLRWLDAVHGWLAEEVKAHPRLVVLGDFNIAPDDRDVHDPLVWNDDHILTSTAERDALRGLLGLGLHDAFRLHHDDAGIFSWWDYRQAAFRRDLGLRIDLTLVSDALKADAIDAGIDRTPRTWERASDHTPAWVQLAMA